jgi:hypothetical protein
MFIRMEKQHTIRMEKQHTFFSNTVAAAHLSHFHTRVCVCRIKANEIVMS